MCLYRDSHPALTLAKAPGEARAARARTEIPAADGGAAAGVADEPGLLKWRLLALRAARVDAEAARPREAEERESAEDAEVLGEGVEQGVPVLRVVVEERGVAAEAVDDEEREEEERRVVEGEARDERGGAAALVAGFAFDHAALLLLALLVVHGLGGYAALLHHHTKHRDALLYAFAQDLSVLGALALLRLTGPGGLSVDARRAKRE